MITRRLGNRTVSAIGLGGMPLSRPGRDGSLPDRERAIATVHAALDLGVTLIDTADCYGPDDHPTDEGLGHNEEVIAEALRGRSEEVVVATKGGIRPDGADWPIDGRPAWLRQAVEGSLRRLGVDAIDLYQHHRPDPAVPYAETMGAMKELYDAGLVRAVGISNADPGQIAEAHAVLGDALVSVQNEFSPAFRTSLPELELCARLGLAFLPWSPLGGMQDAAGLGSTHAAFQEVARAHGVSPQQVCIAWILAQGDHVVPIPGASRPASIQDSAGAVHLRLTPEELARLDASGEGA
ncbi:aryl-alcohol dehydrogenase-like predicted oxidoreductase [Nocardioides ginsengisegetis]|uniref:Aryl-alcohol dehydrogenase-like predicted oxidoreductase n=1 Tax=Nocardioides ginsengisegetis TaxID=661491 RepID=A0A7W3PAQ3_9ACTN|nr:aryl-alcohol dehydrogenase-like predicted oxidoreductase [Nocardioides ginsengisegetis]